MQESDEFYCSPLHLTMPMKHEKKHFTQLSYSLTLPFTALEGKKKLSNLQEPETKCGKPQFWF